MSENGKMDAFVLKRKERKRRDGRYLSIRIRPADYDTIADWADQTGKPVVEIVAECIAFCAERLAWDEGAE